jgi:hypothetical protein
MANKTVENPCIGTGTLTTDAPVIKNGKTYGKCPQCDKLVSINKANRLSRKHTGVHQPTLWEIFEEEDNDRNQAKGPYGSGSL